MLTKDELIAFLEGKIDMVDAKAELCIEDAQVDKIYFNAVNGFITIQYSSTRLAPHWVGVYPTGYASALFNFPYALWGKARSEYLLLSRLRNAYVDMHNNKQRCSQRALLKQLS